VARSTTIEVLRRALRADKRPLLRIANAAGLSYPVVFNFAKGKRKGLSLVSAEKLAAVLGLELRPRKGQVEHGKRIKRPRRT